jgi:hypothetical protein
VFRQEEAACAENFPSILQHTPLIHLFVQKTSRVFCTALHRIIQQNLPFPSPTENFWMTSDFADSFDVFSGNWRLATGNFSLIPNPFYLMPS